MNVAGCALTGFVLAAPSMLIGNDFGVEARIGGVGDIGIRNGGALRVGGRIQMRYAEGPWRNGSFLGSVLPEVGVEIRESGASALLLSWSIYPIDWLFARGVALTLDPHFGAWVPTNGSRIETEMGLALGFRLVD